MPTTHLCVAAVARSPQVEESLMKHPSVAMAAVVGVPDDLRGSIIKAFIVRSVRFQAALTHLRQAQRVPVVHTGDAAGQCGVGRAEGRHSVVCEGAPRRALLSIGQAQCSARLRLTFTHSACTCVCAQHYEYPRAVEFVQELPMTTTGKIQRKVLREREAAAAAAAAAKGK